MAVELSISDHTLHRQSADAGTLFQKIRRVAAREALKPHSSQSIPDLFQTHYLHQREPTPSFPQILPISLLSCTAFKYIFNATSSCGNKITFVVGGLQDPVAGYPDHKTADHAY
ncbi:MAG: hypothetical protein ACSLE5_08365 [Porticoccaceae bacterium]